MHAARDTRTGQQQGGKQRWAFRRMAIWQAKAASLSLGAYLPKVRSGMARRSCFRPGRLFTSRLSLLVACRSLFLFSSIVAPLGVDRRWSCDGWMDSARAPAKILCRHRRKYTWDFRLLHQLNLTRSVLWVLRCAEPCVFTAPSSSLPWLRSTSFCW